MSVDEHGTDSRAADFVSVQIQVHDHKRLASALAWVNRSAAASSDPQACVQRELNRLVNLAGASAAIDDAATGEAACRKLGFAAVDDADRFAENLLKRVQEANAATPINDCCVHLRIAIGDANVSSLWQAAGPDELWIDAAHYAVLSPMLRRKYGEEETANLAAPGGGGTLSRRGHRARVGAGETEIRRSFYVLSVDMGHFRQTCTELADAGVPNATQVVEAQVRELLRAACGAAEIHYESHEENWQGDGAILLFDQPAPAVKMAKALLKRADEHNRGKINPLVCRCFRVGVAHGSLMRMEHERWSGQAIAEAVRLQSGGACGELRIGRMVYDNLPEELQREFGGVEMIAGKAHEPPIEGHRMHVGEPAPWEPAPPEITPNTQFAQTPARELRRPCFIICGMSGSNGRNAAVLEKLIHPACERCGFDPHGAEDIAGTGAGRWHKIAGELGRARLTIAYLGSATADGHYNANIMIEVGYRLALGLPLVLLRDAPAPGSAELSRELPFDLRNRHVLDVPADPAQAMERVVKEIDAEVQGTNVWNHPHAVTEVRMLNGEGVYTYVSPAARKLFGEAAKEGETITSMVQLMRDQMDRSQYDALMKERAHFVSQLNMIIGPIALPGVFESDLVDLPALHVPIVFSNTLPKVPAELRGRAFLAVVIGYRKDGEALYMRTIHLEVTDAVEQTPQGHWICNVGPKVPAMLTQ